MFSGIIHNIGIIKKIEPKAEGFIFTIANQNVANQANIADSVCNTGVCLTVIEKNNNELSYEVMPETLRKTVLGSKKVGDRINLETSLKVGDEVGGHFVFGHVDCVCEVVKVEQEGDNRLITFQVPSEWMKYLCPQGSVALDGVSLTVARLGSQDFAVSLIEYTLDNTTLGDLEIGDKVNVEFDMLAKYVARQLTINR